VRSFCIGGENWTSGLVNRFNIPTGNEEWRDRDKKGPLLSCIDRMSSILGYTLQTEFREGV